MTLKGVLLLSLLLRFLARGNFLPFEDQSESSAVPASSENRKIVGPEHTHTTQKAMKPKSRSSSSKLGNIVENDSKVERKILKQNKDKHASSTWDRSKMKHPISLRSAQLGNATPGYSLADPSFWPNATKFRLYRRSATLDTVIGEAHAVFDCNSQTLLVRAVRNDGSLGSAVCDDTNECEVQVEIQGRVIDSNTPNIYFTTDTSGWALTVQQQQHNLTIDNGRILHAEILITGRDGGFKSDFLNVSIQQNCSTANLTNVETNPVIAGGEDASNTSKYDGSDIEFGHCYVVALLPFTAV